MITAIVYFSLGVVFTFFAINSGDTLWSFRTSFPTVLATIDFGIAIRLFWLNILSKKDKNSSKKT